MTQTQEILTSNLIKQSLAAVYSYVCTGRFYEATETLSVVQRIQPTENPLVPKFFRFIASNGQCCEPDLTQEFGKIWGGENLDGCTIEVFCDQGMGDLIQMLRYIHLLKMRWNCRIVVNCYAYFDSFQRLMSNFDFVDEFVKYHKPCDYFVNFFSLPTILTGIKVRYQYPACFSLVMQKFVPPQPHLILEKRLNDKPLIGVAWRSNPDNQLSLIKSIPDHMVKGLVSDKYDLVSLDPNACLDFMRPTKLVDLQDTAFTISGLDYIVSVDTVVLHLAGTMYAETFALIPDKCDPRWAQSGDDTVWYYSVKILRERQNWEQAIKQIKESIESLV